MRYALLLVPLVTLSACDRIPFLNKLGVSGPRFTREQPKQPVDCDASRGRRPRDGCVTGTIRCGETVAGNTAGGRNNFQDDFYRAKFCMPFEHDYSGPERVYTLDLPAQTGANLWLDSDCADLDLVVFRWQYDGNCPTASHTITECEADDSKGDGMVHVETVTRPAQYMVVVDGKGGAAAPFNLAVDCAPR